MRSSILLFTAASLAAPATVHAQEASFDGDLLVVTGSRLATRAQDAPYSIATLKEEQLVGRANLGDALRDLADVYVQAPGGRSGMAAIFLRGSDPNFTSVLLDGVPLNNPANPLGGSVNVSEIPSAGIERVELVTGPLSSLYGSGALAGVVNLVVPGGRDNHGGEARLGLGTDEDYSAFLRWRGPIARNYGGSLAFTADDAGEEGGSSRFRSKSLLGKLAPLGDETVGRILFRLASTESRGFPDSSGGPRFAVVRELEKRKSHEGLIGVTQPILRSGPFRVDLSGSLLHRRDRTISPGVAPADANPVGVPAGEDETRYWRGLAQGSARYEAGTWQAVAGVESQREVARSEGELSLFGMSLPSGFRGERWTHSAFAEGSGVTGQWVLNAGARIDRVEGLNARVTGRAGLRYKISGSGLSVRAAAGTGFKAPSFYALGNPFVGNPDLAPERSRSIEAGLDFVHDGLGRFSVTGFHTRFANLIDFVPDPVPRLENRSVVVSKGISGGVVTNLSARISASVQLQYAETRDKLSGETLLNRPKWRSSSLLSWTPISSVTVTGRHRFVGSRRAFSVPTGTTRLSGYHDLSFEGAWSIMGGPVLRLVVDNLGGGEQEDAVGFPAPGRRARLIVGQSF